MSNRFKFRVWDKESNKYYDDLYYEAGDLQVTCVNKVFEEYISDGYNIIEQCTGLKDKNGKLIYENDVVEVSEAYENGIYKIEFCQSDCEYNLYNKEGNFIYQLTKSMARYMKVIGNIHENKELLDEQP